MDDALEVVIELNEYTWSAFKKDLSDVTPEEVDWRPLPQANTINLIVRHLRIEALWHVLSLEGGAGPSARCIQGADQPADSMPLDFERNLKELDELYAHFVTVLRRTTLDGLESSGPSRRTATLRQAEVYRRRISWVSIRRCIWLRIGGKFVRFVICIGRRGATPRASFPIIPRFPHSRMPKPERLLTASRWRSHQARAGHTLQPSQ